VAAYDPAGWTDLFVAAAGAAAALTGLVFVAVSINIKAILDSPGLPERALTTVLELLGVAIVSICCLAPGQSIHTLAIELLGWSIALSVATLVLLWASIKARKEDEPTYLASYLGITAPGIVPFIAGAVSLLVGHGGGLYWAFGGIIGALVGGVAGAWVFLVEILR
jgi:hypothetical protein